MNTERLRETAKAMVALGKGILAADESAPTIKKRLDSIGVESTEEARRSYRELLFTTPGLADHISGVILFDETLRQNTTDGTPFVDVLTEQGILPGSRWTREHETSLAFQVRKSPRVSMDSASDLPGTESSGHASPSGAE